MNLDANRELDTLNLNQNLIQAIPAGSSLKSLYRLNTLLLQGNKLKDVSQLQGLLECPSLSVLDLSKNHIEDTSILDLLVSLPNLKVLYLKDNPVVQSIPNYRKTLITSIKTLTYLDDRPVFDDERRLAEAWKRGGRDEEMKEKEKIARENNDRSERNFKGENTARRDS